MLAVLHYACGVGGPLLVHVATVDVELLVSEKCPGHVLERLLFRPKVPACGPPGVRHNAARGPPEPFPHLAGGRAIPTEFEFGTFQCLRTLDEERDVVATDVVARDDIGVRLSNDIDEPVEDAPLLGVRDTKALRGCVGPIDHATDGEDRAQSNSVLDIERKNRERRSERLGRADVMRIVVNDVNGPMARIKSTHFRGAPPPPRIEP